MNQSLKILLLHSCLKDHFSLLFLYYWCFFSQQRRMASLRFPETHPTLLPLALHTFPRSKSSSKCRTTPSFLPQLYPTATLAKPRSYGGFLTYTFLIGWFWWGKDKNISEAWFLQGVERAGGMVFRKEKASNENGCFWAVFTGVHPRASSYMSLRVCSIQMRQHKVLRYSF